MAVPSTRLDLRLGRRGCSIYCTLMPHPLWSQPQLSGIFCPTTQFTRQAKSHCSRSPTLRCAQEMVSGVHQSPSQISKQTHQFPTIEEYVGNTPLVRLQRLSSNPSNVVLAKLEGNNPAGSVKDRPAMSMIREAEAKGVIKPGDTIIEPTSGNTGIALAMAAAISGYRLKLIMPANMSEERRACMAAYGAELITVPAGNMELARDLAQQMQARGMGTVLDQFANSDNPLGHYRATGPELWEQTQGRITHFVSSMGTTGTLMGVSRFLKEKNPDIQMIGLQPSEGAAIAGIRKWPKEYLPKIFQEQRVDRVMEIGQREAEATMRALAKVEGIFAGVSSGGAVSAALRLSAEVEDAVIVCIVCDRGDRYLSTGVFSEEAAAADPQPCSVREFLSAAACLISHPEPHFILFTADPGPDTEEPWCPDCARCLQPARARAAEAGGTLLEVQVGPRAVWKDKQHPLRHHPSLQLTGIPTLVHWQNGMPAAKLGPELEAAATSEEADQLIQQFVQQQHPQRHQECQGVAEDAEDVQEMIQQLQNAFTQHGTQLS